MINENLENCSASKRQQYTVKLILIDYQHASSLQSLLKSYFSISTDVTSAPVFVNLDLEGSWSLSRDVGCYFQHVLVKLQQFQTCSPEVLSSMK